VVPTVAPAKIAAAVSAAPSIVIFHSQMSLKAENKLKSKIKATDYDKEKPEFSFIYNIMNQFRRAEEYESPQII
jgi:hypothetical protein